MAGESAAPVHQPPHAGKKNAGAWLDTHKNEVLLGGGSIVALIALYVHSKTASSSAAAGTTVPVAAGGTVDTTSTDLYNQLESQIANLSGQLQGFTSASTSANQTTSAAAPSSPTNQTPNPVPSAPAGANPLDVQIGSTQYEQIGKLGAANTAAGAYALNGFSYLNPAGNGLGPQVGGGAPVFFGSVGNGVSQGFGQAKSGADVYVPVAYAGNVE